MHHPCMLSMRQYLACDSTRSNWLRHWAKPTKRQSLHRSGASTRHGLDAPLCFSYFCFIWSPSPLAGRHPSYSPGASPRQPEPPDPRRTPGSSARPHTSQSCPNPARAYRGRTRDVAPRDAYPGRGDPARTRRGWMNSASRPSDSTSASRALSAGTQLGSPTLARSASSGYSLSCSATLTPRMYW